MTTPSLHATGLVGNCQYAAHVSAYGEVVLACLPRSDSDPIFARLIDDKEGGGFRIGPSDKSIGEQHYVANSNVLVMVFNGVGGAFKVTDFAPRFMQADRRFRPTQLVRIVEPIEFLHFLLNIAANAPNLDLMPLYRVDGSYELNETILTQWRGYRGEPPVRIGWLRRYKHFDGFADSQVSFIICTFWLVDALCRLNRVAEARQILDRIIKQLPTLGLLSEDIADDGDLWGNFPQAYSHVGLIHAVFAASPDWSEEQ